MIETEDHWYVNPDGLWKWCGCSAPQRHQAVHTLDAAVSLSRQWWRISRERRRQRLLALKPAPK